MHYGLYNRLNVHCCASTLEVMRKLWRKFSPDGKTRAWRKRRHDVIRSVLAIHAQERTFFVRNRF